MKNVLDYYARTESYLILNSKMWSNFMCTEDPFFHVGSHNSHQLVEFWIATYICKLFIGLSSLRELNYKMMMNQRYAAT